MYPPAMGCSRDARKEWSNRSMKDNEVCHAAAAALCSGMGRNR